MPYGIEKLDRLPGRIKGCIFNHLPSVLDMERRLTVGCGEVNVTRDGIVIWHSMKYEEEKTVADIEAKAVDDPQHDWRIRFHAPLSDAVYQRQWKGKWYLVEVGDGFA